MELIKQKKETLKQLRSNAAFTLAEVMIVAAVGSVMMGGIMTTYIMSMKGFAAMSNYTEIHSDGRHAIDFFARDVRKVSAVTSFSSTNLVFTIPTAFSTSGSITATKSIRYGFSGNSLVRTDLSIGQKKVLADDIESLTFSLYDRLGNTTTVLPVAKGIQVRIQLEKTVMNQIQTEDFLSARLDMRNIPPGF